MLTSSVHLYVVEDAIVSLLNMTYVAELERKEQVLGKEERGNDDRVTATVRKVSRKLGVNHFPSAV